jgi:hypothetical protein
MQVAAPPTAATAAAAAAPEPAGPEFTDPKRREILTQLRAILPNPEAKWSTAWACLWLADLKCLEEFLCRAKNEPLWAACFLRCVDMDAALVNFCRSFHLNSAPTNIS